MFFYLKKLSYGLDAVGVVSVIVLIKLGIDLYLLTEVNTKEILIQYFICLCLIPIVIFTVSLLFKKVVNELESERIALYKRISDLEKKTT